MSIFDTKGLKPMLLGANHAPFDDPEWIYELKHDGLRSLAYLDPAAGSTDLRNKRDMVMAPAFPELADLCRQVQKRCILDGELIVTDDRGAPDFYAVQKRVMMSNRTKISMAAARHPATFVAFDLLFLDDAPVNLHPLMARKQLLGGTVQEGGHLAVSRYVEEHGTSLYELAAAQRLEGVVAKHRDSKYFFDHTAKDWLKIKYLLDDDFIVLGYIRKAEKGMTSLVLGQYGAAGDLRYKGHVTLGVNGPSLRTIRSRPVRSNAPFSPLPPGNGDAVWIDPLVVTVNYMPSDKPGLRQPTLKGIRDDKLPKECTEA